VFWLTPRRGGGWTALFPPGGVTDLLDLPARLRGVLEKPDFSDAVVARLFPPAYRDDPRANDEYQGLLRDDLRRRKLEGVEAFERTLGARRERKAVFGVKLTEVELTDEDLTLWLGFLHDMRLLIGTRLDLTDDGWQDDMPPGPEGDEHRLLHRLAYIEESIVEALRDSEKLDRLG
jgi:hypothetical protein